jgi:hypothetical protein
VEPVNLCKRAAGFGMAVGNCPVIRTSLVIPFQPMADYFTAQGFSHYEPLFIVAVGRDSASMKLDR